MTIYNACYIINSDMKQIIIINGQYKRVEDLTEDEVLSLIDTIIDKEEMYSRLSKKSKCYCDYAYHPEGC